MSSLKESIDRYKAKMKLIYQCNIEIDIENNEVVLRSVKNYRGNKFIVPNFINIIGERVLDEDVNIREIIMGENTYKISDRAFINRKDLEVVDLKNVKEIGDEAFYKCRGLIDIDLRYVVEFGKSALYGCSKLANANLDSAKSVGAFCLSDCENLIMARLGDSVDELKAGLFRHCRKLTYVEGSNIKYINYNAFDGCNITGDIITDKIRHIGEYAFNDCKNIESIKLNGNIKVINRYSFNNCRNLKSIKICNGTEKIEDYAFMWCDKIENLELPDNIIIGKQAFDKINIKWTYREDYNIKENGDGTLELSRKEGI